MKFFIWFLGLPGLTALAANPPAGASQLVFSGTPEAARFSGVGRFGGCTASAIKATGAAPSTPAYILTAGHCIDLSSTDIILDRTDTSRTVVFRYLIDVPASSRVSYRTRRVLYSTMKGTDFALIELDTTLGVLNAAGVVPYEISSAPPSEGDRVEWAGIPSNSIPADEVFLRSSPCTVSGRTDLVEWRWLWRDMIRNDCSDIFGGASGSPLFSSRSGTIAGVITTGNANYFLRGPDFECWRDNPCEVCPDGQVYRPNTNYAAPVAALAGCFDSNGVFQLSAPACELDPGVQADVVQSAIRVARGGRFDAGISTSRRLSYFRYKIVREGVGDCRAESGYGAPQPLSGTVRIQDAIPEPIGRYHLCVLAGVSPVGPWQQPRFATVVHVTTDSTPPETIPEITLMPNQSSFSFFPSYRPPDLSLIPIKFDTSEISTCRENQGYRSAYGVPLAIPADTVRLCFVAVDLADNRSEPYEIELKAPSILPAGVISAAGQEVGRLAPGAWASIFGINFNASATVQIDDAAGKRWDIVPEYVSTTQANILVPQGVAAGRAGVSIRTSTAQSKPRPALVEPLLPGLFTPNGTRWGAAAAFKIEVPGELTPGYECTNQCSLKPLAAVDRLLFLAGGIGQSPGVSAVSIRLSGQALEVEEITPSGTPGVFYVTARIPPDLRLRGYLPVTITADRLESTPVYVWFR